MTFDQIIDKLATENAASKLKHGLWMGECDDADQCRIISSEFDEWMSAYCAANIDGDHGEIAELIDLANVCFRRIMFLTGERDA